MHLPTRLRWKCGVKAQRQIKIQGDDGLYKELVPEIHQELLVTADENGDQVFFEGVDFLLFRVDQVDGGGGGLESSKSTLVAPMRYFSAAEASLLRQCIRGRRPW